MSTPPGSASGPSGQRKARIPISLGPVPATLTAEAAGLEPVGDVMGAVASWIGWRGTGPYDPRSGRPVLGTTTSGDGRGYLGYRPHARAVDHAHAEALRRLVAEATGLHADGVLGLRTEVHEDDEGRFDVVLRGTAVRARTRHRPARPFTTDLDGAEVGALMMHRWVPVSAVWGFSVGTRPTDWNAARQRRFTAGNQEVTGYTDLVTRVRAEAREKLAARARRAGADGVLTSAMTLRQRSELRCEAFVRGTAIARVDPGTPAAGPSSPLAILPVRTTADL